MLPWTYQLTAKHKELVIFFKEIKAMEMLICRAPSSCVWHITGSRYRHRVLQKTVWTVCGSWLFIKDHYHKFLMSANLFQAFCLTIFEPLIQCQLQNSNKMGIEKCIVFIRAVGLELNNCHSIVAGMQKGSNQGTAQISD